MSITVNMAKARVIHMAAIRVARNAELAAKDISFMRAVESGDWDEVKRIGLVKEALRDIPQTFTLDAYTNPTDLKGSWPLNILDRPT